MDANKMYEKLYDFSCLVTSDEDNGWTITLANVAIALGVTADQLRAYLMSQAFRDAVAEEGMSVADLLVVNGVEVIEFDSLRYL